MRRQRLYLSLLCLFFSCISSSVMAQGYEWFRGGGSGEGMTSSYYDEASYFMCTDQNRNIYSLNVVGNYPITADTFYRSSAYGAPNNVLLTSYDCHGQMRWAKLIASVSSAVYGLGLTIDSSGHLYVVGCFPHGTALDVGSDTTIPSNYTTAATIQFDTSGHLNWIRFIGPNTFANRYASGITLGSVALDKQQNVHFIKIFRAGSQITSTITSIGGNYEIVYSPSGNLLRAVRLPMDSSLAVTGASIDTSTNKLYIHGESSGLTAWTFSTHVLAAFDSARNLEWIDTAKGPSGTGLYGGIGGLTTDGIGNLYVTSQGSAGRVTLRGDTIRNIYGFSGCVSAIQKIKVDGTPLWHIRYSSGSDYNYLLDVTSMPNGKVAAIGGFAGSLAYNTGTMSVYAGEGQSTYFTIIDTSGFIQTVQQLHGNGFVDDGYAIASDYVGNLYLGGATEDSSWGGSVGYRSVGGNTDFFIAKYGVDCACPSMPVASFSDTGGVIHGFIYTGTTADIDSVRWYFGDGGTSTTFNPTHTYTTADTFLVSCAVYSACGNDIRFTTVRIPCLVAPTAAFTSSGTSATRGFTYTGTTTGIDSVVWTFGDGSRALGTTASHTYSSLGSFSACVTAYNPCGSHSVCSTVVVSCLTTLSSAFTHAGYSPVSFTYTGTTTGLDSVVWHYGDGGRGTGLTSSHTYAIAGSYTACALAYNQCGIDSTCSSFTVPCVGAPIASFASSGITATRSFTYTGTTVGLDSVVWNFGDGGRATGLTSSHTYAATGTYAVCVISYNPCGSDTACSSVAVTCLAAPTASYTSSGTSSVSFTYTGTTIGLDSVVWHLGDGGHATGLSTIHSYAMPDTYTVCVAAYNQCGWDSSCSDVIIPCFTPVSSFTSTGMPTVFFTFTGSSTGVDSVTWDYADGTYGSGLSPVHTYTSSGTYYVCAIVYTICGNDTFCANVTVICPLPIASFTHTGSPTIDFTCGSLGSIDSVRWHFGDGNSDTGITASHGYATSGTFNVCMIVYNLCGADTVCEDVTATGLGVSESILSNIQVYPNPATDEVTISGLPSSVHYKLTNIIGQTLLQGNTPQGTTRQTNTRLHLTHLSSGMYFLHLTLPNNTHHLTKLIIQ